MHLKDYDVSQQYSAQVLSTQQLSSAESSEEIRELVLEIDNQGFNGGIGQNIGVIVEGPHEFGHTSHFRLYTIANTHADDVGKTMITLCVKRCNYIDDYSGEQYDGIASNYLCDLKVGERLTITGPYGLAFPLPKNADANFLLIGVGTGIAPFRAFVKHLYENVTDWRGKVRLYYGPRTGFEIHYVNELFDDVNQYYDEKTFQAFNAVGDRPHWNEAHSVNELIQEHQDEVWDLINDNNTFVYLAGIDDVDKKFERLMSNMAGGDEKWQKIKSRLISEERWVELLY